MKRSAVMLAGLAFAVAGCHGGGEANPKERKGHHVELVAAQPRPAGLQLVRGFNSGPIVVDGTGRTVYGFVKDKTRSACTGKCAETWRPVPFTEDFKITDLDAAMVGSIDRPGGGKQATLGGRPLYTFAGDSMPGEMTGRGADWFVVGATGGKAEITTVLEGSSAVNP